MTSDWGGFRRIANEARVLEEQDKAKPLVLCPICGNVLDVNARGEKNCDVGHYRTKN